MRSYRVLLVLWMLAFGAQSWAQEVPKLTGRVVDAANLLPDPEERALTAKLDALEQSSSRQLVVVTVPNLQGFTVEDFGFRLGEEWKLGDKEADNGAILLVAPAERKIRIEVGDGLEPILTDAMSGLIIRDTIRPRFQAGDIVGGINAGADAIIQQLQAPPEEAERRAVEAAAAANRKRQQPQGGGFPVILWIVPMIIVFSMLSRGRRRHGGYRGRRYGGSAWPIVLWTVANEMDRGRRSGGWGSGGGGFGGWSGGGGGFGGGGFSGGGGSFGGGGASGSW